MCAFLSRYWVKELEYASGYKLKTRVQRLYILSDNKTDVKYILEEVCKAYLGWTLSGKEI